jgi:hypothetical protein
MTGTNNFLPHATGPGANVTSQSSWASSSARSLGFQSGVASSADANKALRQANSMASAIGAFIAAMGYDALDDGDIAALETNLASALGAFVGSYAGVGFHYGTDAGSVNALSVSSVTPTISSYSDGHVFLITPAHTTTSTTPTLNIGGLEAKTIVSSVGGALTVGAIVTGKKFLVAYDATLTAFVMLDVTKAYVDAAISASLSTIADISLPGVNRLAVVVASDTALTITADYAGVVTTGGVVRAFSSVTASISTGTVGANGLDTGTIASGKYAVWLISNGSTISGLLSTSFTSPTMPSGYTYKVYVGAVYVDGSSKLWRTWQYGTTTFINPGTNPTVQPQLAVGPAGSQGSGTVTWSSVSVATYVPSTARAVLILVGNAYNSSSGCAQVYLAPANSSYTNPEGLNPPFWAADQAYDASGAIVEIPLLGGSTINWYAGSALGRIALYGWKE